MAPSNKNEELISMEEGRSNIIVNLQQTTSSQTKSSQPSNVNSLSESLRDKLQSLKDQKNDQPKDGQRPKIQKASNMLRRDEKREKYFEPRMVSIGPLHHGDKFKLAEKLKLKLAALFIKKHNLDELELYFKINGQIDSLRRCYIEDDIPNCKNEDLAWMFLIDGCALIHYIENCDSNGKLRDLKIKMDMEAFAQQDLFLLENQLPYQLLDPVLITSIPDQDQDAVRESISKFVDKIARNIRGSSDDIDASLGKFIRRFIHRIMKRGPQSSSSTRSPQRSLPNADSAHLLELLWANLVGPQSSSSTPSPQPPLPNPDSAHLLELRRTNLVGRPKSDDSSSSSSAHDNNRYSFRNVNELKAAWIQFKSYKSGSLKDIAFERSRCWFTGTLKLPSLTVDDSTEPMFLNLIAFEMCPDFENDFQVSSYISFLDSLIDQQDDVRDLRKAHVLYNALGSDEKVASLFNEIATDVVPNPQTYSEVKKEIHSHFKNQWNTWMGQVYHDHFSSPWTIVAFVGAVAALVMSGLQTWYTIHSPSES